jgi:shikimate dehydrogenase
MKQKGVEGSYELVSVAPSELKGKMEELLRDYDGFNVTIPHKKAIIPLLPSLNGTSMVCGSCNTVDTGRNTGREAVGYTTDGVGFVRALFSSELVLGGRVCILGSGGVARVFAHESLTRGCDVTVAVRDVNSPNALSMLSDMNGGKYSKDLRLCRIDEIKGVHDLLINATPVGMYPNVDACPVPDEVLRHCKFVFDSIYNPAETVLLKKAREMGCITQNGLPMLVCQAAVAEEIWLGVKFTEREIAAVIGQLTSNS